MTGDRASEFKEGELLEMEFDMARLGGVFTALVTPFRGGAVDIEAFEALVERQLEAGVTGLVPLGTTGEAPTLSTAEAEDLIARTVRLSAGRAFVLAGVGTNDTARTVEKARRAEQLGADGCLVITPYYNRPTQDGLFGHFSTVAAVTGLPLMLYSVPARAGVEIAPETAARLEDRYQNIVAIKEAGGSAARVSTLRRRCRRLAIHCGDDGLTLAFLSLGAVGVTSVLSNYVPEAVCEMVAAWQRGDAPAALAWHEYLLPLAEAMFIETSPAPVKEALAIQGLASPELRLPLAPLTRESRARLRLELDRFAASAAPAALTKKPLSNRIPLALNG